MMSPEFVRKLSLRLRSNFLPWLPPFSKVLQDGLRLLLPDEYIKYSLHSYILLFSNVFMLNKCHNALNVHIYD